MLIIIFMCWVVCMVLFVNGFVSAYLLCCYVLALVII